MLLLQSKSMQARIAIADDAATSNSTLSPKPASKQICALIFFAETFRSLIRDTLKTSVIFSFSDIFLWLEKGIITELN